MKINEGPGGAKKISSGLGVMASDWVSEGPGLKPQRLETTFDPGLPKKI